MMGIVPAIDSIQPERIPILQGSIPHRSFGQPACAGSVYRTLLE
jgi:hypothetical protein